MASWSLIWPYRLFHTIHLGSISWCWPEATSSMCTTAHLSPSWERCLCRPTRIHLPTSALLRKSEEWVGPRISTTWSRLRLMTTKYHWLLLCAAAKTSKPPMHSLDTLPPSAVLASLRICTNGKASHAVSWPWETVTARSASGEFARRPQQRLFWSATPKLITMRSWRNYNGAAQEKSFSWTWWSDTSASFLSKNSALGERYRSKRSLRLLKAILE